LRSIIAALVVIANPRFPLSGSNVVLEMAHAAAELRLAEDALRECDLDDEEETALAA
jgi:hypothetical protein